MVFNPRFAVVLMTAATMYGCVRVLTGLDSQGWRIVAVALVWLASSLECVRSDWPDNGTAITLVWLVWIVVFLAMGLIRRKRAWRLAGLALCALTAGKLLLVDMAGASSLTRILAFMCTGAVFVAASWAYHRVMRRP